MFIVVRMSLCRMSFCCTAIGVPTASSPGFPKHRSAETSAVSSEVHSKGELHLALDRSVDNRSNLATRRRIYVRIRIREVNLVEDVEPVGAKLHDHTFCDGNILGNR